MTALAILRRPSMPALPGALFAVALVLVLSACAQWEDTHAATERAREVLGCFDVELERTEAHRFRATGCERVADIVCSEGSLQPVCIRVRARGTVGGEVVADGAHDGASGSDGDPDEGPGEVVDVVPAEVGGPPVEETDSPAEDAIRRGLDARSEDVLACVDRASVAVRVAHAADGAVSITLSGDLRSSPEEGCVRSALGAVRVPAGPPGVVVHLVRRRGPSPSAPPEPEPALPAPPPDPVTAPPATVPVSVPDAAAPSSPAPSNGEVLEVLE